MSSPRVSFFLGEKWGSQGKLAIHRSQSYELRSEALDLRTKIYHSKQLIKFLFFETQKQHKRNNLHCAEQKLCQMSRRLDSLHRDGDLIAGTDTQAKIVILSKPRR